MKEDCQAVVLAAGNSGRMGVPKAFLTYDEQHTFIEHIVSVYAEWHCRQIVVVVNPEIYPVAVDLTGRFGNICTLVVNPNPEQGRLVSVRLGMAKVDTGFCFLHNIDNPFTDADLLTRLYLCKDRGDVIIPSWNGKGGHPVLLSWKVVDGIRNATTGDQNLHKLLDDYNKYYLLCNNEMILRNINTQEEFRKWRNEK
ncbi:MAG: NTP transferase domain-containing protein [Lentimicrobiaceae bacterium]|nr:NTP transferase domain-containing protein [Lentimicrobiaceae bacterium]